MLNAFHLILTFQLSMALSNALLFVTLFSKQNKKPYAQLSFFWGSVALATTVQLFLIHSQLEIALSLASFCVSVFIFTKFLSDFNSIKISLWPFVSIFGLGLGLAGVGIAWGRPFWVVALPISVTLTLPLFWILKQSIATRWNKLSFYDKALILTALGLTLAILAFPFFRLEPLLSFLGYQIVIFLLFCASIFCPVAVIERIERENYSAGIKEKNAQNLLYFLGHEVQNGLNVIRSSISLINKGVLKGNEALDAFSHIEKTCAQLMKNAEHYLYYETLSAGLLNLSVKRVSPTKIIDKAVEQNEDIIKEKSLKVNNNLPENAKILGDQKQLEILFYNLVYITAKHSRDGATINLKKSEESNLENFVVSINDKTASSDVQILEPSSENKTTVEIASGLGFPICRKIIEGHNGKMILNQSEGEGSTVTVSLPVSKYSWKLF